MGSENDSYLGTEGVCALQTLLVGMANGFNFLPR